MHHVIPNTLIASTTREDFQKFGAWLLSALILLTTICIFVPFYPSMPGEGLDPSWRYGMNQAVAQNFAIGRDITFTFGPYASIYTKVFHPATDGLMVWGSLYLGLSFGVLVLLLFKESRWFVQLGLLLTLSCVTCSGDTLLFYYPLMVGLYCYKLAVHDNKSGRQGKYQGTLFVALLFPIGLLPLIKGSIFILCGAIVLLIFALFALLKKWNFAFISIFSPILAIIIFWIISGQTLVGLPSYFTSFLPIISGYTEAMMVEGEWQEVAYYIIASIALLWTLFHEDKSKFNIRIFLVLIFSVSLFVVFKAGFVRHDGHAIIAGTFLLLATFLLNVTYDSNRATIVFIFSIFVWVFIDSNHVRTSPESMLRNFKSTYSKAWHGIKLRIKEPHKLDNDYKETVAQLNAKMKFPKLQGTTDIYSYNQSYLIASENIWNPRPTFQSYSVYTPSLVEKNKNHLLGTNAPNNLIFKVEPIDGRLPSLEDGASWPIILSNYEPTLLKDDFLFLNKLNVKRNTFNFSASSETYSFGETIFLPSSEGAIFAKINISQTILGKIANTLYKPTQIQITLNLESGVSKSYRLVSGMAKTDILISPLIENTSEFGLMYGGMAYLQDKKVKSFVIDAISGHRLWKSQYEIEFINFNLPKNVQVTHLFNFQHLIKPPANFRIQNAAKCDGNIDIVNGSLPASVAFSASALLSVNGWLSVFAEKGLVPDMVMLVLTDKSGHQFFAETRQTSRPDVGDYFKNKRLDSSGYSITVDTSQLQGQYSLGLAYERNGEINICPQFNIPGNFKGL